MLTDPGAVPVEFQPSHLVSGLARPAGTRGHPQPRATALPVATPDERAPPPRCRWPTRATRSQCAHAATATSRCERTTAPSAIAAS
eukprot:762028-Prymnesium_polylepis.2